MSCQLPKFLNSLPFLWVCYQSLHRVVKTRQENALKSMYHQLFLWFIVAGTLTVEICCWGAGVAGSGIQGVRVAALPLRVPARAGRGEGGGWGVAWVLIHLLKLPLEKPTHGVSANNLQERAEGGVISKLFTLIWTALITNSSSFVFWTQSIWYYNTARTNKHYMHVAWKLLCTHRLFTVLLVQASPVFGHVRLYASQSRAALSWEWK